MTGLFKIGTTDLTKWENTDRHDVNQEDVYETWTDGNYRERRQFIRTRVTGSVELGFKRPADFTAFLALLSAQRTADGYYPVTVWVSNVGAAVTIDAFLECPGVTKWDLSTPMKYEQVNIDIFER